MPRAACRSSKRRPTSITSRPKIWSASRPKGTWKPYDDATERIILDDFKRLWATNFLDNLWIDVEGLHLQQRRGRQDRRLQHGGAAARQDRRLRRLQEHRDVEDRRQAEGRRRGHPPRHVHRSGAGEKGRGHRARDAEGEGLSVRRGDPRDSGDARVAEARPPDVQDGRRAEGQDPHDQFHRQQGDQRPRAQAADEGQQGAVDVLLPHRPRHLSGSQVRRRRGEDRGVLPRSRVHQRARRRAGRQVHRGLKGQEDALDHSGRADHRRAAATRSAISPSTATPSSSRSS